MEFWIGKTETMVKKGGRRRARSVAPRIIRRALFFFYYSNWVTQPNTIQRSPLNTAEPVERKARRKKEICYPVLLPVWINEMFLLAKYN